MKLVTNFTNRLLLYRDWNCPHFDWWGYSDKCSGAWNCRQYCDSSQV